MATSTLHYIQPLGLSDTFHEWYLRSNSIIDVVNNINIYDVELGWGFAKFRNVDGTLTARLNSKLH